MMKAKQRTPTATGHAKVLVIEDERDLQDVLRHNLTREGYAVLTAGNGQEAIKSLHREPPNLILLDLMLPGMDGLDICRLCKSDASTASIPIVMLTAKDEEADIVLGLELGADDYVLKPFSFRVLLARIKAVLRRKAGNNEIDERARVVVGELSIDQDRHEVRVGEEAVTLTHTEFQILYLLARRAGRVYTRSQIVRKILGDNMTMVTERSVDVHIVSLRRKLGAAGTSIQTVRGVGYRLEEEAAWHEES